MSKESRQLFPALANKAYFNFGAQGTMARETLNTIAATYDFVQSEGPFSNAMIKWIADEQRLTRESLALRLGGSARSFALTQNVTEGCNIVLWGLDWKPGERLVISDCEHNGVIGAAEQVARRNSVTLDTVAVRNKSDEEIVSAIAGSLRPDTRLVVLSHVLWNTGQVLPVAEIQRLCRERGVFLLVDGAQSAGVLPLDLPALDCDFYAVTGHKWLCGPDGIGALYVKPSLISELKATFVGWRRVMARDSDESTIEKFEVGTIPFPLLSGLRKALDLHDQFGTAEQRHSMILANVARLREHLSQMPGISLITPAYPAAGLVSFTVESSAHDRAVRALEAKKVFVRTISDPDCLRASVHYLNDDDDISALAGELASWCSNRS